MGIRMAYFGNEVGIVLKERRLILGLTQQQVADKAGIKIQHYQAFEGGQRNLMRASFRIACSVLEALDLDIAKFYHEQHQYDCEKCGRRR